MKSKWTKRAGRWIGACGVGLLGSSLAWANHPVFVEGNSAAGPGVTVVPPGTAGDFDGDGRIGTAEDNDNDTDRVFGTITAALGSLHGGANQNGRVTIVTSGRFPEQVNITGSMGNVTLEAAPGVEANIDAVLGGDANNVARQAMPGIVVTSEVGRRVTLRNLVVRNWQSGIACARCSHVTIDNVRVENNLEFGIHMLNNAQVAILRTQVTATGFRIGSAPDNLAENGIGIQYSDHSTGLIADTAVTMSFGAGISNVSDAQAVCRVRTCSLFDNAPNIYGVFASEP